MAGCSELAQQTKSNKFKFNKNQLLKFVYLVFILNSYLDLLDQTRNIVNYL